MCPTRQEIEAEFSRGYGDGIIGCELFDHKRKVVFSFMGNGPPFVPASITVNTAWIADDKEMEWRWERAALSVAHDAGARAAAGERGDWIVKDGQWRPM